VIELRRTYSQLETIFHEFGPTPERPLIRCALAAVMTNPFAYRYEPDIAPMMESLTALGATMAALLHARMGVAAKAIEGYGKGAMVGAAGELEHGALWHVPGGYAMREYLEARGVPTRAIVASTKKVGAPSVRLDVPITHVNASYVRSHFDAMEVSVPGAPAADELVYILVMTTGARIHARVGGLAAGDVEGEDGLR
jgi:hypothetical protein